MLQRECSFESRLLFPVGEVQWPWSHKAMEGTVLRGRKEYKGSTPLKPVNSSQRSPAKGIWNAFLCCKHSNTLWSLLVPLHSVLVPWAFQYAYCNHLLSLPAAKPFLGQGLLFICFRIGASFCCKWLSQICLYQNAWSESVSTLPQRQL